MPYASISQARDAILGTFKTAWDAQTPPVPPVVYDGISGEPPRDGGVWARVSVKHGPSAQATIGGSPGNKRFRRIGFVVIQLFVPIGQGLTVADRYAKVAVDAFEGKATKPDGAFFYNVRANEIGPTDDWFQMNILAEFQWDEVK